ncbi:MAG: class I tRNA ligase family protein, partial [Acidobacteriaceae bacterium]|nr:class I tRNA ligase family protein [Acidobacteriaceae bacterium]
HSSLLVGVGLKNQAPYRECATHGWTLDAEGRAMSKSLGNTIEPETVVKQKGADLLRLWVASVDYMEDVRMSEVILDRLSEAYRKLRNTFRWMLGNLGRFDPVRDSLPGQQLAGMDAWILVRAEKLVERCLESYKEYAFHKVYRAVYDFAITDLSAIYFDVLKDRLYTAGPSSEARRSAQTALYRLNLALVRLLAPILSFTCEEVWRYTAVKPGSPQSVHLAYFSEPQELTEGLDPIQRGQAADWELLVPVRDQVLKALDGARENRVIGASLEAAVSLTAGGDLYDLLQLHLAELPAWFIVSYVDLERASSDELAVSVDRARGDKCERCWKYTTDVGSDPAFATVCAACASVLPEFFE